MSDTKYNGWANYATWRVNLEVIDDYVSQEVYDDAELASEWAQMDAYDLGQQLKEYADEVIFSQAGFDADNYPLLCSYADSFLSDVNWTEIGDHAVEQAKEAIKYAGEQ